MKQLWSAVNAPLVIFFVAMFLYNHSKGLPPPRFEPMGPAFFPRWVLTGIIILSLFHILSPIVRYFRGREEKPADPETTEAAEGAALSGRAGSVLLFATIGMFALYIGLIVQTDVHFLSLTFGFICLLGFVLSGTMAHWLSIILTAAGTVAALQLVFGTLLEIFFP